MPPAMRVERLKRQYFEEDDFQVIIDVHAVELEIPEIPANMEQQRLVRPICPPTVPLLNNM